MLLSKAATRYARTAGTKHACVRPAKLSFAPYITRTAITSWSSVTRPLRATSQEAAPTEAEEEEYGAPCSPAFVVADNSHPHYTQLSIDVADYPGLLRVITWVMNGLSCRVHNAVLRSDEGLASDVFWVTDMRGRKLSDAAADDVADRLEEFVSYCAPPSQSGEFTEYNCGDISISNLTHPQWTEVSVVANIFSPGLLFEMASIFHGQGIVICEGLVRGGSESPIPLDMLSGLAAAAADGGVPEPPPSSRVMRFWVVAGKSRSKLDYADVSALLYTLRVVLGDGGLPTRPPNRDLSDLACPCSDTDDGNVSSGGGGGSSNNNTNAVRGTGTAKGRFSLLA